MLSENRIVLFIFFPQYVFLVSNEKYKHNFEGTVRQAEIQGKVAPHWSEVTTKTKKRFDGEKRKRRRRKNIHCSDFEKSSQSQVKFIYIAPYHNKCYLMTLYK